MLFAAFREACAKLSTKNKLRQSKQQEIELSTISDIDKETQSLKEINDIRDELRMILRIFRDQAMVLSMMNAAIESNCSDVEIQKQHYQIAKDPKKIQNLTGIPQIRCLEIDANIREWQKMLDDADAVQNSVWRACVLVSQALISVAKPSLRLGTKANECDGGKVCSGGSCRNIRARERES